MNPSPLEPFFEPHEPSYISYGDVRVAGAFEGVELEYAAIRKRVALFDAPQRGLVRLTGTDRLDFLHRLLTCDCNHLKPGDVTRAFMLNVKGRITADLIVAQFEDATLLDVDLPQAAEVIAELDKLLFGEDVQLADLSVPHHRVSLHGPGVGDVLEWWKTTDGDTADAWTFAHDEAGELSVHVWAPAERAVKFGEKLDELGEVFKLRPVGWLAFNIARIEAGHALFHVDFGPDNLPHETGTRLLADAVSFTKGCYRGQEIVARMQSLGHPSKTLVPFRVDGDGDGEVPVAATPLLDAESGDAATVGAVTSSTYAPMLSQTPIGFAMVKWGKHTPDTVLYAPVDSGERLALTVQRDMRFYQPGASTEDA